MACRQKQPDISEETPGTARRCARPGPAGLPARPTASLDRSGRNPRDREGVRFYFAVKQIEREGPAPSVDLLPEILAEAIDALPWPKSMRWADRSERWVRPIHARVCALRRQGGEPSRNGSFPGNVESGSKTVGHRFLAPEATPLKGFADYAEEAQARQGDPRPGERREIDPRDAARSWPRGRAARLKDDPGLAGRGGRTGRVAGSPAWAGSTATSWTCRPRCSPPPCGRTRSISTLRTANPVTWRPTSSWSPTWKPRTRARPSSPATSGCCAPAWPTPSFFWDEDRKADLASRALALEGRYVFHAELGSLDDKVDRMQALAAEIAGRVPGADPDKARAAARLCKADLTTGMVGEFPELQGIMGRYYARATARSRQFADAIREHYSPLGPNGPLPDRRRSPSPWPWPTSWIHWSDFFAIDEKPTGSKDPFALRRAALGVIRLIFENGLRLPLDDVCEASFRSLPELKSAQMLEVGGGTIRRRLRMSARYDLAIDLRCTLPTDSKSAPARSRCAP